MYLPLDTATVLTIVAFLLIAWDASRTEKNPLLVLGGFFLLLLAIGKTLFGSVSLALGFLGFFINMGLGLLLAALLLTARRARGGPFFALGLLAFALATLLYAGLFFLAHELRARTPSEALLLELGPDDRLEEVLPILARHEATHERAFPTVRLEVDEDLAQVYLVYVDPAARDALLADLRADAENVDHLAPNGRVSLSPPVEVALPPAEERVFGTNDPLAASQWALAAIRAPQAYDLLRQAQPRRRALVAIVDTGVDGAHEDVETVFRRSPGDADENGHGTHCAGLAGAVTNNGIGMASLNWRGAFVEVAGYRALGADGSGSHESIAQAIIDAALDGADVISLSLGDYAAVPPKVVVDAVELAQRRGAIVAASAGNAGGDALGHMPSNIDGVIAVAAVDERLKRAAFSNRNTRLARPLAAPGVNVLSLEPGGGYVAKSGTSMSTPVVAGLLGVLRALRPDLTADEAYDLLYRTGRDVEDSHEVGRLVDAEAAIRAVLAEV